MREGVLRAGVLVGVVLFALGAAECDPQRHAALEQNSKNVQLCRDKGGIPIVAVESDADNHVFTILVRCEFPCDQRVVGEKQ